MIRRLHILLFLALTALLLILPGLALSQPDDRPITTEVTVDSDESWQAQVAAYPEAAPEALSLTTAVLSTTAPVHSGDIVTFTINLENQGSTPLPLEIRTGLAWPLRLDGRITPDVMNPSVTTFNTRVKHERDEADRPYTFIRWRGELSPGAELQLAFPVRAYALCQPGQSTADITHEAGAYIANSSPLIAQTVFSVQCPPVTLDDIEVVMAPTAPDENSLMMAAADPLVAALDFPMRVTITNHAGETAILTYRLEGRYIGETEKNITVLPEPMRTTGEAATPNRVLASAQVITLAPGQSYTITQHTDSDALTDAWLLDPITATTALISAPAGSLANEAAAETELTLTFNFQYGLLPYFEQGMDTELLDPDHRRDVEQQVYFRPWDLGDAPDNSNHAGTAMTAYPGIQAHFPTVFDPAVGAIQGPAHAQPQHFHLGRGVDLEVEADLGGLPNIDPATNSADQDQRDDGAVPHTWNLTNCQPGTVAAQIYISPAAAAWFGENGYKGYLNGWLDGNRDGDWRDSYSCPSDELPLSPAALEHLIIDHEIDVVTLGPGLHTVTVPTGRAPWPAGLAGQPAWVRLTLSEQPAVKPFTTSDGVAYGDGRGHGAPTRTGETEDYRMLPPGAPGAGADLSMEMTGGWRPLETTSSPGRAPESGYQSIIWSVRADYANNGSATAEDVILTLDLPDGVSGHDAEIVLPPDLPPSALTIGEDQIFIDLDVVAPGERGRVLAFFRPEIGDEVTVSYQTAAAISSAQDINTANDSASFKVEIEGVTQGAFGFKSPDSPFLVRQGTTNSDVLLLQGRVPVGESPPAPLPIWISCLFETADCLGGTLAEDGSITVVPDANGDWSHTLTDLADGAYRFAVGHPNACDAGRRSFLHGYGTVCGLAVVDSRLEIDPISLGFTEVSGLGVEIYFLPNTLNWSQGDWRVRLPQGTYSVTVNLRPTAGISATLQGMTSYGPFETKLLETEIPGRYQGNFILGDGGGFPGSRAAATTGSLSLFVGSAEQDYQYEGGLTVENRGQVQDGVTGVAVANATVTLWTAAMNEEVSPYLPWDGSEYGQSNPVNTDVDGLYYLSAPAGLYQLQATADGYQPYRREIVSNGGVFTDTLPLAPVVAGEPDLAVTLSEDGFEPAMEDVPPNSVVQFINAGISAHRVIGDDFDSGLLLMGESFTIVVGESGVVSFYDATQPGHIGTLNVDPSAGQQLIFLPIIVR